MTTTSQHSPQLHCILAEFPIFPRLDEPSFNPAVSWSRFTHYYEEHDIFPLHCWSVASSKAEYSSSQVLSSVPCLLKMLTDDPVGMGMLCEMEIVGFGGAAHPQNAGDMLVSKGMNLVSRFGSGEMGSSSHLIVRTSPTRHSHTCAPPKANSSALKLKLMDLDYLNSLY
jgi:hypothetical protein